ncbi:hypothetical protein ABW19_dt0201725 [Dactylella cylindrospora]|nr:hypothetical protein ABW19_dt0201725 [Dactylella cylindrospora]
MKLPWIYLQRNESSDPQRLTHDACPLGRHLGWYLHWNSSVTNPSHSCISSSSTRTLRGYAITRRIKGLPFVQSPSQSFRSTKYGRPYYAINQIKRKKKEKERTKNVVDMFPSYLGLAPHLPLPTFSSSKSASF